jgi:hypothetical protein
LPALQRFTIGTTTGTSGTVRARLFFNVSTYNSPPRCRWRIRIFAPVLWRLRGKAATVNIVTPPRGTVCPSDRLPFDPEFGQPMN